MFNVIPLYPVRRAFEELQELGRTDLRRMTARMVRVEVQSGRDGMAVKRQLQQHRLQARAHATGGTA